MSAEGTFLVLWLGFCGAAGCAVPVAMNADRIVVAVLRRSGAPLFPLAVSIAVLIYKHPDQWSGSRATLSHPKVGSIWIANGVRSTKIETEFGEWKPNWIERRIIRDAVDWRIETYIRNRITQAMRSPYKLN